MLKTKESFIKKKKRKEKKEKQVTKISTRNLSSPKIIRFIKWKNSPFEGCSGKLRKAGLCSLFGVQW